MVLRYCPLEGSLLDETQTENWACVLEAQLHVLRATVALREPFQKRVQDHHVLRLVHVPGWAGKTILIISVTKTNYNNYSRRTQCTANGSSTYPKMTRIFNLKSIP